MRTIKLILLTLILAAIVLFALAHRDPVTLRLLPQELSSISAWSIEAPHYVVALALILLGMVLGYILEWLREHKHRRMAAQKAREAARLDREVGRLRRESGKGEDEVLALLRN
jgi:uncharacterized integral membrane protein